MTPATPEQLAIAGYADTREGRVWIPPTGKPYWVTGPKCSQFRCGPDLTDEELARYLGVC